MQCIQIMIVNIYNLNNGRVWIQVSVQSDNHTARYEEDYEVEEVDGRWRKQEETIGRKGNEGQTGRVEEILIGNGRVFETVKNGGRKSQRRKKKIGRRKTGNQHFERHVWKYDK